ncbi:hypothetical protein SCUCBS95973_004293 [Sporothrix curviconia]|uniref:Uncharacterized protein n=1 Tax=Sporothrix curviconia TaxID=1260050 RepID=A0ABP0BMD3_9PEZI
MATPPPRPMAMDPLHITEFASDRYFTKFNQQQQRQQTQNAPASGSSSGATAVAAGAAVPPPTPAVTIPFVAQPSSPFFLPLSETTKSAQETVDEKDRVVHPELKQKKSRFHLGRLLHTKSQAHVPTTPSIPLATPAPAAVKPIAEAADIPVASKP